MIEYLETQTAPACHPTSAEAGRVSLALDYFAGWTSLHVWMIDRR